MRRLFLLAAFLIPFVAPAEVFLLGPGKGTATANIATAVEILRGRIVFKDPVVINDQQLQLQTFLIRDLSLPDALLKLHGIYPAAQFTWGKGLVKVTVPGANRQLRMLLINNQPGCPLIGFAMEIPNVPPARFNWPTELPITADGQPILYQFYPARNLWQGSFSTSQPPATAINEIYNQLVRQGWTPAPGENVRSTTTGLVLMRASPPAMITVNFNQAGHGTVVLRQFK